MIRQIPLNAKEIAIPITFIERVDLDTVYLRVDKKVIDGLPSLPVHRPWNEVKATDLDLMVRYHLPGDFR